MSSANETQIGGTHYRSPIQHWDYIEHNQIGYLEGCATKYLCRARKKHADPTEDYKKAIHYCLKINELYQVGKKKNNSNGEGAISLEEFANANNLTRDEREFVLLLTHWQDETHLFRAIHIVENLLKNKDK